MKQEPITFIMLHPSNFMARFKRTISSGGTPFARGVMMGVPVFKMRRWYWPWSLETLEVALSVNPPRNKDGSLRFTNVTFRLPPLIMARKVWVFAPVHSNGPQRTGPHIVSA